MIKVVWIRKQSSGQSQFSLHNTDVLLNYSMSKALYDRVYIWKRRISKEGLFFMEQVTVAVTVTVAVRPVMQPVPPHGSLGFQQGLAGV